MSLDELKRQNAEVEEEIQEQPQLESDDETEAASETEEQNDIAEGSDDTESSEEDHVEAWMQSDDQTSQDSETVPVSDLIKMRTKLKGKVSEKNEEIESLRAEIQQLKTAQSNVSAPAGKPKRDDFYDRDDPDEAYLDALSDWKIKQQQEQDKIAQDQAAFDRQQQKINEGMNAHYERAAKLLEDHSLSADMYKSADASVRSTIQQAANVDEEAANAITDNIISQIGEGSEKLVMYIGNNASRKEQLKASLMNDPSGLSLMRQIGKWESEMSAPKKRTSSAPKPAKRVSSGESNDVGSSLMKKYLKAHESNDTQKAFDIKRAARAQNIDVSKW